jgi:hypothetical protein
MSPIRTSPAAARGRLAHATSSLVLLAAVLAGHARTAEAQTFVEWSRIGPSTPLSRIEDTVVYDSVASREIMFGGYDLDWNRLNDLWYYDGASKTWTDVTPPTGALPTRRSGQAMAFDPVRKVVVLFGGLDDTLNYLGDTWEWDTIQRKWTTFSPVTSPTPRQGSRLVYDAANSRTLLVGGVDAGHFYNQTWAWNGTTWTLLSVTTPTAFAGRAFPGATYNPVAGHGVTVFGGIGFPAGTTSGSVVDFNDVWELRNGTWTNVSPAGAAPPGRGWTQLAYDTAGARLVMFGGFHVSGAPGSYGDTWALAGGVWTQIIPEASGPGARDSFGMVYDAARQKVVLFGGYFPDVIELTGNSWALATVVDWPPGQDSHAMAYDSDRDIVFLYGGGSVESWELNLASASWTRFNPSGPNGRTGFTLAYEPTRRKMLLFGGRQRSTGTVGSRLGDTWEWDTTAHTWTNVTPATSPQARDDHAMAFDPAHNRGVMFGGRDVNGTPLGDTWLWTGTAWANVTATASGPSARYGAAIAYDAVRRVIVLFGGNNGSQNLNDVWEWDGDAVRWHQVFPSGPAPGIRAYAAMSAFDVSTPGVAIFGGLGASQLNDTWIWNGTSWSQATNTTIVASARQHGAMVYDTAARRLVLYGGRDVRGVSPELWTGNVTSSSAWPAPILVTPSQGQGPSATFTAVFRHAGGESQIREVLFLVNSALTGAQGAYLMYSLASNTLSLRNDADSAWSSGVVGTSGVLSNSQVSIDLASTAVFTSATDATLSLPLIFRGAFNGAKNIYMAADDLAGASPVGWQVKGTFLVSSGNSTPQMLSVSPASGAGLSQTFTAVYRDANGVNDLQQIYFLVNSSSSGANAALLYYVPASNLLYLRNDADTDWGTGVVPGSAGVLANSQVTVDVTDASVVKTATDLTLTVPLTFNPGFAGARTLYLFAVDFAGAHPSLYQPLGTFTVSQSAPPSADVVVYRPSDGTWNALTGASGWVGNVSYQWGVPGDQPLRADFDGDGKPDLAVYRPSDGTWYIRFSSSNFSYANWVSYQWGVPGDIPVPADFDGDGKADLVVFRPSNGTWYVRFSSSNYSYGNWVAYQWGLPGDQPLRADFDGDGKADLVVFRPSDGTWYVRFSSSNYSYANWVGYQWGVPGDVPMAEDFDGDGKTDLAVYRPSNGTWYLRFSSTNYSYANWTSYQWGVSGDIPVLGDFDGDGKADLVVWRPSNATWYTRYSANGYSYVTATAFGWGLPTDIPLAAR